VLFLHMNLNYPPLVMGAAVTGIELGVDSCVLVRVHRGADAIRVDGIGGKTASDWDDTRSLTENLAVSRRSGRFPRHATVVAWDLYERTEADPFAHPAVGPIRDAGFVVDAVLSPPEALCLLAERRPRAPGRGAEVWLALNRHGVAIAIIDGARLLYSWTFDWHYHEPATPKDELLQRYSLVAHLAPEVRHGLDVVRAEHGTIVDAIITCGDLPDLRSLTMPLIEELDIEVETLDTLEGIRVAGTAASGEMAAERAPAMRLACVAAARSPAAGFWSAWRLVAAAAVLIAILLGAWMVVRAYSAPRSTQATSRQSTTVPVAPVNRQTESSTKAAAPAASAQVEPSETAAATTGRGQGPVATQPVDIGATATSGRSSAPPGYANSGVVKRDDAVAQRPERPVSAAAPTTQSSRPLSARLPVVNSILVAPDRRLAVLDGEIVREGETFGPRVVVRIEPAAVVLREPSGYEVRVPIRRKLS
jgi:hypothetical protein